MDLKKPYSINEQIKKLEEHGVVVDDVELTRNVLQQISYYRLSGYMLQHRINPHSGKLTPGIKFINLMRSYAVCSDIL